MKFTEAYPIAKEIMTRMETYCEVVHIGGSLRRCKKEVGDIEIVASPLIEKFKGDLFGNEEVSKKTDKFIAIVRSLGKPLTGKPSGRMMKIWLSQGIQLDLFMPKPEDFYRIWAIRTGSADYSGKVIAYGWNRQGWCGTEAGLRRIDECINTGTKETPKYKCTALNQTQPPVWQSEEEFFDFIGVKWIKPEYREISIANKYQH